MTIKNSPEALGKEIIQLARSQLLVNFRFLDHALLNLKERQTLDVSFTSDGVNLYYDPWFVLKKYNDDENEVTRNYLHTLLHLIFRHGYVSSEINNKIWNLSCDIAVEMIISDFNKPFLSCKKESKQSDFIEKIQKANIQERPLNAERIYDLIENMNLEDEQIEDIALNFWGDSHGLWYNSTDQRYSMDIDAQIDFEEIAKRMQVELELLQNDENSLLVRQLRKINRKKKNYKEVLRKFCVNSEIMKISDEEFDNNYYSYGLKLYGNMPIIESLEYSEGKKIREFVIAIDTSGSINSKLAEKFISQTYKLLSNEESFHERCEIHIIQCDDRIREDKIIRNKDDMDDYINNYKVLGLGETDFRPVFEYINSKRNEGSLRELKGLIYFTDGDGIFPESPPDYDVMFVIHQDRIYESVKVPAWSIKMELDDEDIINGRI